MNATFPAPALPRPRVSVLDVLDIVDTALATVALRLPAHVSREDLASAGRVALIAAVAQVNGTIDEVRAYCFSRVRGAMFDELRRLDPLSRRTRARVSAVRRAAGELELELGRAPSDDELAEAVGVTPAMVRQALRLGQAADSPDSEPETLASVPDTATVSPAAHAEAGDLAATIRAALTRLPERHARVVRRYHFEDATLDEIAGELGVSIERVRQLRQAAEKKLREDDLVVALWPVNDDRGWRD